MQSDEVHMLEVPAMLRMTEYLIKAALNLRLGRAERLFSDAIAPASPAGAPLTASPAPRHRRQSPRPRPPTLAFT